MRSIKELAPKPSDAITAMIEGLKEQSQRKDFEVDMLSFGRYFVMTDKCFGCAATCTLQKLYNKNFSKDEIFTPTYGIEGVTQIEVQEFELMIDDFRKGGEEGFKSFLLYYDAPYIVPFKMMRELTTGRWRNRLKEYEAYRDQLKSIGL